MKFTILAKIFFSVMIAMVLNIISMVMVSRFYPPNLIIAFFAILWGTMIGAFLLGYWMKKMGWFWGLMVPILLFIFAGLYHRDRIVNTILIYTIQLIPASLSGELGARYAMRKNPAGENI